MAGAANSSAGWAKRSVVASSKLRANAAQAEPASRLRTSASAVQRVPKTRGDSTVVEALSAGVRDGVAPVSKELLGVLEGKVGAAEDQNVLRVAFLGSLGEVE